MKKKKKILSVVMSVMLAILALDVPAINAVKADGANQTTFQKLNVRVTQIDSAAFPKIKAYVSVTDENGKTIPNLTSKDFQAIEQSNVELTGTTETPIDVSQVSESGGLSLALVLDKSGSMDGSPIADAKSSAKQFLSMLDYAKDRSAIVDFSSTAEVAQKSTYDKNALNTAVDNISADGWTALYDGIYSGVDELKGETGSKAVIAFTDGCENNSQRSMDQVINYAKNSNIPVYTIGLGYGIDESTMRKIATDTKGSYTFAPEASTLKDIFNSIAREQRDQYVVSYNTHNPNYDGTERTVTVQVNTNGNNAQGTGKYKVVKAPEIKLTSATTDLMKNGQQLNTDTEISAQISDTLGLKETRLFYRPMNSDSPYTQVDMINKGGSTYSYTIPAASIQKQGVEFYITASNGTVVASNPMDKPTVKPNQIAVGNNPPTIKHTPVTAAKMSEDIKINADITDDDSGDSVKSATLYYRVKGELKYNQVSMTNGGTSTATTSSAISYSAVIPKDSVKTDGVEYYISATDSFNASAYNGTDAAPNFVLVKGPNLVTSIAVAPKSAKINVGKQQQLTTAILPDNADSKDIKWTSSDETIATVDNNGMVTGIKQGKATITATPLDGTKFSDKCDIEVISSVTGVTLDQNEISLNVGDAGRLLYATVAPATADNKNVTWSSDNEAAATVDNTGKVTPQKEGTANITVTTLDGGLTATCKVTVTKPVLTSLSVDPSTISLTALARTKAVNLVGIYNNNAAGEKVNPVDAKWTVKDPNVATIIEPGVIAAKGNGSTTVTADINGITTDIKVDVKLSGTAIKILSTDPADKDTGVDLSKDITVKFNQNVLQAAGFKGIKILDEKGVAVKNVTAEIKDSTLTIKHDALVYNAKYTMTIPAAAVKNADQETMTDQAVINFTTVNKQANIFLDPDTLKLEQGRIGDISLLVDGVAGLESVPNSDINIKWSSDNEKIATVYQGKVTAVKIGKANITAEYYGKKAVTAVEVIKPTGIPTTGRIYNLKELMVNGGLLGELLASNSTDSLKVVVPERVIKGASVSISSTFANLATISVQTSTKARAVTIRTKVKEDKYDAAQTTSGNWSRSITGLAVGDEVMITAFDASGNQLEKAVTKIRKQKVLIAENNAGLTKYEYTLQELIDGKDLFSQILTAYSLSEINVIEPLKYLDKYSVSVDDPAMGQISISVSTNAILDPAKVTVDDKELDYKGDGQWTTTLISDENGIQAGSQVTIKVYDTDGKVVESKLITIQDATDKKF